MEPRFAVKLLLLVGVMLGGVWAETAQVASGPQLLAALNSSDTDVIVLTGGEAAYGAVIPRQPPCCAPALTDPPV